jgi:hypothetical protein
VEERTTTLSNLTEAFGNLLIKEKLPVPTSILVAMFLLIEVRKIFTTLFWRKREAQNNRIRRKTIERANHFRIPGIIFIHIVLNLIN